MPRISTHVLDIALGRPAAGIEVELWQGTRSLALRTTNQDGRTDEPMWSAESLETGEYELAFRVGEYLDSHHPDAFFRTVRISFLVADPLASYHVPLLLAPHGYSTYRGS